MAYKKPKPLLRNTTMGEISVAVQRVLNNYHQYRNCLNCIHWDIENDKCKRFNAKPPTEIVVYSCEAWEDNDDIPF